MREEFKKVKLDGEIKIFLSNSKGYWRTKKRDIVNSIIGICEEYASNNDNLTLRQLYYQLVSKDLIPNHDKVYKKLSKIKDDIVYGGFVDWDIFEDRGRVPSRAYFENDVEGALQRTVDFYKLDRQDGQSKHIEVWTEKDAISGILKKVTTPYTITLVVNKGYSSSTAMYKAYERFLNEIEYGRKVVILYFGDHDPSGLDMVRDIKERIMFMFTNGERFERYGNRINQNIEDWWSKGGYNIYDVANIGDRYEKVIKLLQDENEKIEKLFEEGRRKLFIEENDLFTVKHIGLTMEQIKLYNPPPNPAKLTDPRAKWYIKKYGEVSYEVDALKPSIMRSIVEKHIRENMDLKIYDVVMRQEQEDIKTITKMINNINN